MSDKLQNSNESHGATSRVHSSLRGAAGALIAAVAGPIAIAILGTFVWPLVRGLPGILIAGVIGSVTGAQLTRLGPAKILAIVGGCCAALGAYLTIGAAETNPPGSLTWALEGGLAGAVVSAVLGLLFGFAAVYSRHSG